MNKNKYLPMWTDRCKGYDRQYMAANIICGDEVRFESLLPVRFCDDLTLFYKKNFENWINNNKVSVENAEYTFAKQVYKKAVHMIKEEFPDAENIGIKEQMADGVYPIVWRYPPALLKEKIFENMKKIIEGGFYVTEYIECELINDRYHFSGVMHYDERFKLFEEPDFKHLKSVLNKKVSYNFEKCKKYYICIDDEILMLGNQIRVYNMLYEENKPLFEAAIEGNAGKMLELADDGKNINAISPCGEAAIKMYVEAALRGDDYYGILPEHIENNLNEFVKRGANVAILGVDNRHESILSEACVRSNAGLVRWLLGQGVSPDFYMYLDDYCSKDETLIDWVGAHRKIDEYEIYDEEDRMWEEKRVMYQKEIYKLLTENKYI